MERFASRMLPLYQGLVGLGLFGPAVIHRGTATQHALLHHVKRACPPASNGAAPTERQKWQEPHHALTR